MEIMRDILAVIGGLCVLCTALLAAWIALVGSREISDWPDEDATLDVQNHHGDSRPVTR